MVRKHLGKVAIGTLVFAAVIGLAVSGLPTVGYAGTYDGGHPAAKATCQLSEITLIDWADVDDLQAEDPNVGDWEPLLSNTIKTANKKDLFIDVSLECGLYTRTLVKSKGGNKDTSSAEAAIQVQVLVDGQPAHPGPVVFSRRMQQLSATLEGMIGDAMTVDDNNNVIIDPNLVEEEEIELILETTTANSFNFVKDDLSSGVHTIEVQARIGFPVDENTSQQGQTEARGMIGKGSVTVEEVRLIKDEDILLED